VRSIARLTSRTGFSYVPHAEALMEATPLSSTNYSYRKSGKFATSPRHHLAAAA